MIPEKIKQAYAKHVKQGLNPIVMMNHETGKVFLSFFSLSCYKSMFYVQLLYVPEVAAPVYGKGLPKITVSIWGNLKMNNLKTKQ